MAAIKSGPRGPSTKSRCPSFEDKIMNGNLRSGMERETESQT